MNNVAYKRGPGLSQFNKRIYANSPRLSGSLSGTDEIFRSSSMNRGSPNLIDVVEFSTLGICFGLLAFLREYVLCFFPARSV